MARTPALGLLSKYAIDKSRSVRASYQYSRLRSVDWANDGLQYGSGGRSW